MSNYNSTATATIYVNGQPAQQTIAKLKDDVLGYKKRLQEIAADKSLGVNSKEWNDVRKKMVEAEKELGRVQSGVANVAQAMLRLDKATPAELRKSLKQLKSDLDNIERGSKAWDEHQRKIKAVKEELAKINNESKAVQGNLWDRFAKKMFDWGAALQTVMATITGVTMTARKAVQAFAEMDQEMASVRKFTGMTADEVERLNEEFKKMDTRSSREQLNRLAQEAGRLGMQSQEDVMGFVRAADKINVALDDLGEGATLTLSKLTDIFGDRQRLGVEKSLLSVGSVINELSQNCTASAPYLAEFASRMGGVGAQAGMTTQQILGFGAVLDTYNQKVESSSTALSQVIVRLYREPEKYAKVAGLEVKQFAELMKTDMNAALIQFLETLNKAGGMDVLSPMFKDMGENGARAIQALSTLATHIDDVKKQQEVANQAFNEAISIDKEFNVQNNTVQAGLEKAKKNFNEMAVTLGEKLAPVMRYAITSSSALMKVIATVVDFLVKYKGTLITLTSAIVAYTAAVKLSNAANFTLLRTYTLKMTLLRGQILLYKAVAVVMVETKAAVLALRTAYFYLTGNIVKMKSALADLQMLMTRSNPWGMAAAAVAALIALIVKLIPKQNEFTKSMKETIATANGMNAEFQKEQHELDVLWGKLKATKKGTDEYKSVKDTILKQYRPYLEGLIDENGEITNLAAAYDRLTMAIRRSAQERGIAAAREKAEEAYYSETEKNLNKLQEALEKAGIKADVAAQMVAKVSQLIVSGTPVDKVTSDMLAFANGQGSVWNSIKAIFGGGEIKGIIKDLVGNKKTFQSTSRTFDAMQDAAHPLRNVATEDLTKQIKALNRKIEENNKRLGKGEEQLDIVTVVYKPGDKLGTEKWLKQSDAIKLRDQLKEELAYRNGTAGGSAQTETTTSGPGYTGVTKSNKKSGHDHNTHEDKFKAEKEWREREEALNRIAYATGQKNYEDYTKRMLKIEEQFYKEQLKHADLTKNERIVIGAQLAEVQRKQVETTNKFTIEEEDKAYADRKAFTQQMYLDGMLTAEQYNKQMELSELQHLKNIRDIYKGQAETAIKEWEEVRQKAAEQMKSLYKGNVDLLNRPVIDAHELTKAGWSGNPTQPGEATATVYSSQYGIKDASGAVREILVTPILPDGSVLSEKQLEEYIQTKLEGAEDILAADDKGIVIAVDVSTDGKAGEDLHKLQEAFYSLKPNVDEKAWENYLKANATYQDKVIEDQMKKQKEYEEALKRHNEKLNDIWENYFKTDEQKKREYYEATKALIDEAYQRELAGFALTSEEKLKIEEAYQRALAKLRKEVFESRSKDASSPKSMEEGLKSVLKAPFKKMKDKNGNLIFDEDDLANLDLVLDQAFASVSSMYDSLNKLWEAEEQLKLAKLEQRYDREISMAEGNAYKIRKLEKKKDREQAQIKAEAQKRQFAQQVLSAIAQTATAAINAYSSAAAIPYVGYILAPIAAAMATAAGLMQVAVIKQQQTLSSAQGYSEGGFTPEGPADKPVGIVHAGEWVASQKLLKNPATRPAIEALDFAQRNNTFGSITQEDVTRHVTAPVVIAQASSDGSMERAIVAMSVVMRNYQETMQRLGDRLDEPFVTVATVSGDKGIKQAQDEYQRLQNNSLPKSKRK